MHILTPTFKIRRAREMQKKILDKKDIKMTFVVGSHLAMIPLKQIAEIKTKAGHYREMRSSGRFA